MSRFPTCSQSVHNDPRQLFCSFRTCIHPSFCVVDRQCVSVVRTSDDANSALRGLDAANDAGRSGGGGTGCRGVVSSSSSPCSVALIDNDDVTPSVVTSLDAGCATIGLANDDASGLSVIDDDGVCRCCCCCWSTTKVSFSASSSSISPEATGTSEVDESSVIDPSNILFVVLLAPVVSVALVFG